jgi:hypothetical protein
MTEVALKAEDLTVTTQGVIDIPTGWSVPSYDVGRVVMTPLDLEQFRGAGFLPNINATIEPNTGDVDLELGGGVPIGGGSELGSDGQVRDVSVEISDVGGRPVAQLIGRCRSGDLSLIVVCSAAIESWPLVAESFDHVVASAFLAEAEGDR